MPSSQAASSARSVAGKRWYSPFACGLRLGGRRKTQTAPTPARRQRFVKLVHGGYQAYTGDGPGALAVKLVFANDTVRTKFRDEFPKGQTQGTWITVTSSTTDGKIQEFIWGGAN